MTHADSKLAVLVDFDGTITTEDIGDLVIETFAREDWRPVSNAFARGEISLRELWAAEISYLSATDTGAMLEYVREVAKVRPGFHDFVDFCGKNAIPLEVASSGMTFYINAVLDKAGVTGLPVAAPSLAFDAQGRGLVAFEDGLRDCGITAMCKCERVWQQRRLGRTVLFVGDGSSDYCAALQADHVVARRRLADYCTRENVPFTPFEHFDEVRAVVEGLVR
jgi:2-hydroxy-3-keto-5-methylthiopentenyl-1-phosphate phosphatase